MTVFFVRIARKRKIINSRIIVIMNVVKLEREVNRYLVTIPVSSWDEAKLLGSDTNWKILDTLGYAGIEGLTVEEIVKKIKIPKSTVYNVLSKLQAGKLVGSRTRRRKWGRPTKEVKQRFGGKPTRVYFERVSWGEIKFDEDFYNSLEPVLENYKDKLKKILLPIIDSIVMQYKTDKGLEEFFPRDRICENCEWSHEATDFIWAVSIRLIGKILEDEDFVKLARKHKFVK